MITLRGEVQEETEHRLASKPMGLGLYNFQLSIVNFQFNYSWVGSNKN